MPISRWLLLIVFALASFVPCAAQIYSTGPTNGTVEGYFIDGPGPGPHSQTITNGFIPLLSGNITGISFGEWVPAGTLPTTVAWSIGTTPFGSELASGIASSLGLTLDCSNGAPYGGGTCAANKGYDVYDVLMSASGFLTAGNTYYLTLGGANDSAGTQRDAWDLNGGLASCLYALGGVNFGPCGPLTNQTGIGLDGEGNAFTIYAAATPEPSALLLLGSGILSVLPFRRGMGTRK